MPETTPTKYEYVNARGHVLHELTCPVNNGGKCDCWQELIRRQALALEIAEKAIQDAPHKENCQVEIYKRCDEWLQRHLEHNKDCDCWKFTALARIERAKNGRTE